MTTARTAMLMVALALSLVGSASAALVAHYEFEGTTDDSSGNNLHGAAHGGPSYVAGALGQGLRFDGVNDYVDCGTFDPSEGTGQLSLSVWARWDGLSGQYQGLVSKRRAWGAATMMWLLELNVDTGNIGFFREGSYPDFGNHVLPIGEWTHVVISFNGSVARMYINGVQVGSSAFSFGFDTAARVVLGASELGPSNPFNGALDDIRIYNHALSTIEVEQLFSPEPPEPPSDANGFTYQGRLLEHNVPANGHQDFQFRLFDDAIGPAQQGDTAWADDVAVVEGYFTVVLDFGHEVFDGNERWLEIGVRPGDETDEYTILEPRQPITPTPYAMRALTGSGEAGPPGPQGPKGDKGDPGPQGPAGGDADNLGDHTATQNIDIGDHWLSYDGGDQGVRIRNGTGLVDQLYLGNDSGGLLITYSRTDRVGYFGVYDSKGGTTPLYVNGITVQLVCARINTTMGIGVDPPNQPQTGRALDADGAANLNIGKTGPALYVNGDEAIWYNGTHFTWGRDGSSNYFNKPVSIGTSDPQGNMLAVMGPAAKPGGGSWSVLSDARLKDIAGDYEAGLAEVTQLNPVHYSYRADTKMDLPADRQYVGVVAQEVRQVIPEAVEENASGYLMVNNDPIIWAMVNAIRELDAHRHDLQADNVRLRNQVGELTARLERIEAMMQPFAGPAEGVAR